MAEADKQTTQNKSVRTDAKSKADPQTQKKLITRKEKELVLKGNDRKKDDKRTQQNG